MKSNIDYQEEFFNDVDNQYDPELIAKPPRHTQYELQLVEKRLAEHNVKALVDYGAGTGRVALYLMNQGYRVTAVDISQRSLDRLQILAKGKLKTQRQLPKNEQFGAIVGADVLHHLNLAKSLEMFHGHLAPNGIIVFSEPNALNFAWYLWHPLVALVKRKSITRQLRAEKGLLQCYYWGIVGALKKAGYRQINLEGYGLLPPPLFNQLPAAARLNNWLGKLPILKLFAYRFIIYAKK